MPYLLLAAAIASEVVATLSLKASDGLARPGFVVVVAVGYLAAFALLSLALQRGIPLGVAYGIWAAAGVAAVAILSIPIFGESLAPVQWGGLALVIAGVVALETGGAH